MKGSALKAALLTASVFAASCASQTGAENNEPSASNPGPKKTVRYMEPASPEQKQQAMESVKLVLKDPMSAQFEGLFLSVPDNPDLKPLVCGRVNAKNSFGGYAGAKWFFVDPKNGPILETSGSSGGFNIDNTMIKMFCLDAVKQ